MRSMTRIAIATLAFAGATAFVGAAAADKLPDEAVAQAGPEAGEHKAGDPSGGHGTGTGQGGGGGRGLGHGTGGGTTQHGDAHGTGEAAGGGGGHGTGTGGGGGANRGEPARDQHGPAGEHDPVHADEHGGHHGPEAINWTDVLDKKKPALAAVVINLGILLTLYYWLGKKPVADALKQRRVNIGKDIDDAERMLKEAEERAKLHQASLTNIEGDAKTAQAALVAAGEGEVQRMLAEAEERSARMKRDAERLVEQERKQMRQDLLMETIALAADTAEATLKANATAKDHERLAEELLAELTKVPAATTRAGGAA